MLTGVIQKPKQIVIPSSASALISGQQAKQTGGSTFGTITTTPTTPFWGLPFGGAIPLKLKEKGEGKKILGWVGYAKHGKSFVKVTKKPTSRLNATSQAMRVVDQSTSRRWKVEQTNQKIKPPKQIDNFARSNSQKFRLFKQQRGTKQNISQGGIELSKYAIDTPGERAGITALGILTRKKKAIQRKGGIRGAIGF